MALTVGLIYGIWYTQIINNYFYTELNGPHATPPSILQMLFMIESNNKYILLLSFIRMIVNTLIGIYIFYEEEKSKK